MQNVVIFHKADFDGIFCREIARKFLPDAELIGWDYGDPTPAKETLDGTEQLYMLDISVADLMDHPHLIWIDHHKSAMEKWDLKLPRTDFEAGAIEGSLAARAALPPTNQQLANDRIIPGYRIDGVAACRLAWQWFLQKWRESTGMIWLLPDKKQFVDRLVEEPRAVRLAGEYDIWDKRDPDAELFQHGLRSEELYSTAWDGMLDENGDNGGVVTRLLNQGRALQYARTKENESIIKELGFTLQWESLTFLCCNHARYNSHLFTAGLKPEHDACFGFKWTGKYWSVSLYHAPGKEHHDLSLIAVKYGGGGHKGACGFRTNELPFLIKQNEIGAASDH